MVKNIHDRPRVYVPSLEATVGEFGRCAHLLGEGLEQTSKMKLERGRTPYKDELLPRHTGWELLGVKPGCLSRDPVRSCARGGGDSVELLAVDVREEVRVGASESEEDVQQRVVDDRRRGKAMVRERLALAPVFEQTHALLAAEPRPAVREHSELVGLDDGGPSLARQAVRVDDHRWVSNVEDLIGGEDEPLAEAERHQSGLRHFGRRDERR